MSTLSEQYTILGELGKGGFATVFKVRHKKLGYVRAVRVLNTIIAQGEADATYQKFLEECRLLLRLGNGNHPHIVHIYQPLLLDQQAVVEMDYVDGENITNYLLSKGSFVEIEDVMNLLMNIGSALAYCHHDIYKFCMDRDEDDLKDDPNDGSKLLIDDATRKRLLQKYRVIHNDIHSGNIIRREDGTFVLLDFGLAIEGDSVVRSSRRKNGAPEFKAPEKWDNDALLSTQSDIYSFGVVLYEFLAGRVPFLVDKTNSNFIEAEYLLSKAHKETAPEPIFELRKAAFERTHPGETYVKDYPDWLEQLFMKCLEKPLDKRFADGRELFDFVSSQLKTNAVSSDNSSNGDYAEDLAKAKESVSKLKAEKVTLLEELEDYKQQLENYKNNADDANKKELEAARNEADTLKAKVAELEQKIKNLLEQLELLEIETKGGASAAEVAMLRSELATAQLEITKLHTELDGLKSEKESLNKTIATLKQENDLLKKGVAPAKGSSVLWQILAVVFFLAAGALGYMHFMMGDKPSATTPTEQTASAEKVDETSSLEVANKLEVQQEEMNALISERDSLQTELTKAQSGGNANAAETINKLNTKITNLEDNIESLGETLVAKDKIIVQKDTIIAQQKRKIIELIGIINGNK